MLTDLAVRKHLHAELPAPRRDDGSASAGLLCQLDIGLIPVEASVKSLPLNCVHWGDHPQKFHIRKKNLNES